MGNSFTSNISKIKTQHVSLDEAFQRIETEANRLTSLILERKYTDRDTVCSKLGYQKVDELSSSYQVQTLEGVSHRLGIRSEHDPNLEANKNKICLDVVNFYLKKINLITNIQKELPKCREMENKIYDELKQKLNLDTLSNEEWYRIYNKLENFNQDIAAGYNLIENELEKVRKAKNMRELENVTLTVNTVLNKTNSICQKYNDDLIELGKSCLETPKVKTVIQEVPVIQRTIMSPKIVRHEVIQKPVEPLPTPPLREETPAITVRTSPQITQIVKQKLPQIPVERIPETSTLSSSSKREVRITGEKIQRGPLGITVKNPSKVEYSRVIPKEHARKIKRVLQPGTRTTKIEPIYEAKSVKSQGIPVRAVADHIPRTSNELPLREGQPTLYLGTSSNGWARVRHADNTEGFVPHSYLSK
jgi:Variant SH3 domain